MADEQEIEGQDEFLTIIDRVENERQLKREFWHGRPRVFKPGQKEMIVPRETAVFLMKITSQHHVWTTEGDFVNRYAVKHCPEDLLGLLGGRNDTEDVTRDLERVEGWDIVRMVPAKMVRIPEDRYAMRERQGAAPGAGVGER